MVRMLGCDMELRSTPGSFTKLGEFDMITGNGGSLPVFTTEPTDWKLAARLPPSTHGCGKKYDVYGIR